MIPLRSASAHREAPGETTGGLFTPSFWPWGLELFGPGSKAPWGDLLVK